LMCFHKSTMYKVPRTKYNIFLSLNLTFEVFKTSKVLVSLKPQRFEKNLRGYLFQNLEGLVLIKTSKVLV
jgi:hypothetical protein